MTNAPGISWCTSFERAAYILIKTRCKLFLELTRRPYILTKVNRNCFSNSFDKFPGIVSFRFSLSLSLSLSLFLFFSLSLSHSLAVFEKIPNRSSYGNRCNCRFQQGGRVSSCRENTKHARILKIQKHRTCGQSASLGIIFCSTPRKCSRPHHMAALCIQINFVYSPTSAAYLLDACGLVLEHWHAHPQRVSQRAPENRLSLWMGVAGVHAPSIGNQAIGLLGYNPITLWSYGVMNPY